MEMLMRRLAAAMALVLAMGTGADFALAADAPSPIKADAAKAGWNAAALERVLDYAKGQKTTGFMIVQDRKVIAEVNWPLAADAATFKANFTYGTTKDGALLEDIASGQKSYIAMIAAAAIDRGYLDLGNQVSFYAGQGWSKASPAQEAKITVRNLMEMNSGLTEQLTYEAEPGTKFFYNTPAYAVMKKVLEGATLSALDDLTRRFLTEPAGLSETAWRKRPGAFSDVGNPTGLVTSPRDMVKFGQLVLDGGKAGDKQVVSKTQLDALFKRTATNPAYGHLWWLNGSAYRIMPAGRRIETSLIPAAPADLVAALGAQDRKIYVVPSRKLIVVRTGQATPDREFDNALWTLIMQAAPAK
jgi:CubicO group peptidase (beta-lactamase class C family)